MRIVTSILCGLALAACGRGPSETQATATHAPAPATSTPATSAATPAPTAPAQGRAEAARAATPRAMPPPDALTDAAITEKIRSAIQSDPGMAGADVSINIDRGVVVLAGTVNSHEQSGIASAHAQRQDGVVRVDNQLRPALS